MMQKIKKAVCAWFDKYEKFVYILLIVVALVGYVLWGYERGYRFDQYATTICSCIAGIVATMFGLTAASYAFIWGDLRTEASENKHLQKILQQYKEHLWKKFLYSLVMTVITIFTSLIVLMMTQNITGPSLYMLQVTEQGKTYAEYFNSKYILISLGTVFNCVCALISILIMAMMNHAIFQRKNMYDKIAEHCIREIENKYNLNEAFPARLKEKRQYPQEEFEKIHSLEMIVDRIVENHASIGEAFEPEKRREKLLSFLFAQVLDGEYGVGADCAEKDEKEDVRGWNYLMNAKKRESLQHQYYEHAKGEYDSIVDSDGGLNDVIPGGAPKDKSPKNRRFLSVYEDMLAYRDNTLVYTGANQEIRKRGRWLRFTIKKRLLFFYMKGEKFDHMDLSNSSFSGADLRNTCFAHCNLTGIKLKGANCGGTDFSGAKMTGMYFYDVKDARKGEIPLSCLDDGKEDWDPYEGKQVTYMECASFADADVSRAQLNAPIDETSFSMIETNFDRAKMCISFCRNIDFTKASFKRTQLFDSKMRNCTLKSADLTEAVLTNSEIEACDFENANLSKAFLAESVLKKDGFQGANLMDANFSNSCIAACSFEEASCQNASFKNVIQKSKKTENCSGTLRFCYATITNADFSGSSLEDADFSNAIGSQSIFTKVKGKGTIFTNAMLTYSIWNSGDIIEADFENTVMRNAVFIDTEFTNCRFWRTDFSEALFDCGSKPCFVGGVMWNVNFSRAVGLTAAAFHNITLINVEFAETGIHELDFLSGVKLIDCHF